MGWKSCLCHCQWFPLVAILVFSRYHAKIIICWCFSFFNLCETINIYH